MMIARIPVALVAVVVLAGCTSTAAELPVRTEYSKTSAFHEWKTFRFASDSKTADYTRYPRYEKMVQQALEEELTARGYTRIEDGPPEFRVAFDLIFRGEKTPRVATEGGGADYQDKRHRTAEGAEEGGVAGVGGIPAIDRVTRAFGGGLR
jgi:hypothetical protein